MDPQKLSQLDPKLREAYQRVMGTTIPEPQAVPASPRLASPLARGEPIQAQTLPMPTPPVPDPTSVPPPMPEPEPIPTPNINPVITPDEPPTVPIQPPPPTSPISQPESISTPEPAISPEPPVQTSNFVQMNSEVPAVASQNFSAPQPQSQAQAVFIKKKSVIMMPILFVIAGLVFIVIYTLFWTKIFNFKLPFLP